MTLASLRADRPAELFLLCWIVPSWIVFELVSTKLPHYTMPLYPAIALLTARAAIAFPGLRPAPNRLDRVGWFIWFVIGMALAFAMPFACALAVDTRSTVSDDELPGKMLLFAPFIVAVFSMCAVAFLMRGSRPDRAIRGTLFAQVVMLWFYTAVVAPRAFGLTQQTHDAAEGAARLLASDDSPDQAQREVVWCGFWEDSVVFLSRGEAKRIEPDSLRGWFVEHPDGLAICSVYAEDAWREEPNLRSFGECFGPHYTKGRLEKLSIVRQISDR